MHSVDYDVQTNDFFKDFTPPHEPSFFRYETLSTWFSKNLCTLGLDLASDICKKRDELREHQFSQVKIRQKISEIGKEASHLRTQYISLLGKTSDKGIDSEESGLNTQFDLFKKKIEVLGKKKDANNHSQTPVNAMGWSDHVLEKIASLGLILTNFFSCGLYGSYQNHILDIKIKRINAQNNHLTEKLINKFKEKIEEIEILNNRIKDLRRFKKIENPSFGQTNRLQNGSNPTDDPQIEKLKRDLAQNKEKLEAMQTTNTVLSEKLNQAKQQAETLKENTKELEKLQKLMSKLRPIPSKYVPQEGDGQTEGAIDYSGKVDSIADPIKKEFFKKYLDYFEKCYSAADVIKNCFEYTVRQLLMPQAKGMPKINFYPHKKTAEKENFIAFYRSMVFTILAGAKVQQDGCSDMILCINESVTWSSSHSEFVLRSKKNVMDDSWVPYLDYRYQHKDDFTPSETAMRNQKGIDPVAVKWILQRLPSDAIQHLKTYLMAEYVRNDDPAYVAMILFLRDKSNPHVKLVEMAHGLITDLAEGIQLKFGQNVIIQCFNFFKSDVCKAACKEWPEIDGKKGKKIKLPFVKPEVPDTQAGSKTEKSTSATVPWIIKYSLFPYVFSNIFEQSISVYENYFTQLSKKIEVNVDQQSGIAEKTSLGRYLIFPPEKEKIDKLTFDILTQQYYLSHSMIGFVLGIEKGEHCLYSALMAILSTKKELLKPINVKDLKKVMVNYLKVLSENTDKDSIERYKTIKNSVYRDYNKISMADYLGALSGKNERIDFSCVTDTDIDIIAWALGVRIGVLEVGKPAEVDEYGRIIPSIFYGPNTSQLFLLAFSTSKEGTIGTYYGAFPKLNLTHKTVRDKVGKAEYEALVTLDKYWKELNEARTK